jgi:hypothetical protein
VGSGEIDTCLGLLAEQSSTVLAWTVQNKTIEIVAEIIYSVLQTQEEYPEER